MAAKTDPLESWHALQAEIHNLDEKQLAALIAKELAGKKRRNMVLRMHMKFNKLRYARENAEYTKQTVLVRAGKQAL
jgi:hypothetical protein